MRAGGEVDRGQRVDAGELGDPVNRNEPEVTN
jgi:hypothetical protein